MVVTPLSDISIGAAELAAAWWCFAEVSRPRPHPLAVAVHSFAAAFQGHHEPAPRDRVAELRDAYVRDEISIISFEIELEHLPGGLDG